MPTFHLLTCCCSLFSLALSPLDGIFFEISIDFHRLVETLSPNKLPALETATLNLLLSGMLLSQSLCRVDPLRPGLSLPQLLSVSKLL